MQVKLHFVIVLWLTIRSQKYCSVLSSSTFVVSFQSSGGWSTNDWIEFKKEIPPVDNFTSCHWEKIRYFSSDIMAVWSYCIAHKTNRQDINCVQLYSSGNGTAANQQLVLMAWLNGNGGGDEFEVNIAQYKHRSWNHICWSYSSTTGTSRFYYNGKHIGNRSGNTGRQIPVVDDSKIASFIIGQEPDVFNGEFSVTQLFNGEISEFNFWDKVLSEEQIMELGECKKM